MARLGRRASSRRSRQVQQGTIGTHVSRPARASARRNPSFKNSPPSRTGEISHVIPQTRSRESSASYAQRSRQRGFVLNNQRGVRVRKILLVIALAAALLGIALGVMWTVFKGQVGAKMALDDPALSEVLAAPESQDDPFYLLVAGKLEDNMREDDGPHMLVLVRIDPVERMVTLVSLPHNIETTMSDDEYHILSYAEVLGGNAELVTQVENLCRVEVSHVLRIGSEDFVSLVDSLGGITLDVEQEADDPDTGSIYIPPGEQNLDGQQALALVRCDNYATPLETRSRVQAQVVEALVRKVLAGSRWSLMQALDSVAGSLQTTLGFDDVWNLAQQFGDGGEIVFYSGMAPGFVSVDPDGTFFSVQRAAFDNMMAAVDEGRNPDEAATISGLTPSLVKITVRNGAGITGGASQVASILEAQGYQVPEVGNADNYVYDETLVVYKDELMKPTAEDVLAVMGNGRTIEAGLFYDFKTDIMVIIGKDWTPKS